MEIANGIFTIIGVIVGSIISYYVNSNLNKKESWRMILNEVLDTLIEIDHIKHKAYKGTNYTIEKESDVIIMTNKIVLTKMKCNVYGFDNTSSAITSFEKTYIQNDKQGYKRIKDAFEKNLKKLNL